MLRHSLLKLLAGRPAPMWLSAEASSSSSTCSCSSGAAAAAAAATMHPALALRCISHTTATSSSSSSIGGAGPHEQPQQQQQQQQQQRRPRGHVSSSTTTTAGGGRDSSASNPPPPKPDLVDRVLSPDLMSRRQLLHHRKAGLIGAFQRFPGDTGSTEVQVALLTDKIRDMMEHARLHRKDQSSKRGLQGMLNRRRALLAYLRRTDFPAFSATIHRLGLRDNVYARQARYDRYRVGSKLGVPAEPIKAYGHR